MAEINLSQKEADSLFQMEKRRIDTHRRLYPSTGGDLEIPLISLDKREKFILTISRKGFDLSKGTYQKRARNIVILARLDIGGSIHRNPDGEDIPPPHLHLYKEGYADKWAIPIQPDNFPNIANLFESIFDFMKYCNITDPPFIDEELPYGQ